MDKFLETYNLPKLNQEELQKLNGQIIPSEIEIVIKKKKAQHSKDPDWMASQVTFTKHFEKN